MRFALRAITIAFAIVVSALGSPVFGSPALGSSAPPLKLATASLVSESRAAVQSGAVDAYFASLSGALDDAIKGKAPKVATKLAATDAGALALMQWRLLARIGPEVRLDAACADCLGWLLADPAALAMFLGSGEPAAGKWPEAMRVLAKVAAAPAHREGLALRLSIATALIFAEPVKWMADGSLIDPVARVDNFLKWDAEGALFPSFRDLSAWELRFVVGSWSSDSDLVWARANIKAELKERAKVGEGAHMLAYKDTNPSGVSVQAGGKFYDNKPMTLAIMLEYGGVCGAISRFGTSMSQAFGVPAMPVGQPGHCAFIWQKEPHAWSINNDISGWAESGCHAGIFTPWGQAAWFMPLMQQAQSNAKGFVAAELLLVAAEIADADDRAAIAAAACDACPQHYGAWLVRIGASKAQDFKRMQKDLTAAFARNPAAFAELYNRTTPASGGGESAETKRAHAAASAIAAMAKGGADAGLSSFALLVVLQESAARIAGGDGAAAARALVQGGAPGNAKLDETKAREVAQLALSCADLLDVAPTGPAHDAWTQAVHRAVRGIVRQPAARASGLKDIEQGIAVLMKKDRAADARWLADRVVDAAKEAKDPDLESRAAALRKSLG